MRIVQLIEKGITDSNSRIHTIGTTFLLFEMVLIIANIIGRYALDKPIGPTYELSGLFIIILLSLCWGHTEGVGGHVRIEILINRLPSSIRNAADIFNPLLSLGIWSMVVWAGVKLGLQFYKVGAATDLLEIPFFPFALLMALGALSICFVLFFKFLLALGRIRR